MPVQPTRRATLVFLAASFAMSSTPARSGGEGGKDPTKSTAPPKDPALQERYSQADFANLSKREIATLYVNEGRVSPGGPRVKVDGFSGNMVEWLISMADFDRPSFRRLIRDMAKIKDKAKRKARLAQEIAKIKTRITKLEAAKERAHKRGSQNAVGEAESRLYRANEYLEGVEVWAKFPHEGTR